MLDIFSARGFLVHRPCGPRKSGMPESVEMPAPVRTTTRLAASTQERASWIKRSGHLNFAAAAHAAGAHGRQAALRHHDRRGRLAPQLLQLLHGALDRFLRELAELLGRFLERAGADLERDRQRAGRRQHLRLADIEHRAPPGARAILADWRQAADGADPAVGEDLLEVQRLRVDLDFVNGLGFRSHAEFYLCATSFPAW